MKSESEVAQSCPTLSDPMDCSLPDSSIHGIFQARVLEWGAIAFSDSLDQDKMTSLFYTLVTPMLNPLIYSLQNKAVKVALEKLKNKWL